MEVAHVYKNKNTQPTFLPNEFMKESFSVDRFLSNNKNIELEVVGEDLNHLSKTLKKSMIKLINADYQDFVHVSTNLKDFKASLKILKKPLASLKIKISNVKHIMENHVTFIEKLNVERYKLKILRRKLISLKRRQNYITYLNNSAEIERISRQVHFIYYTKFDENKFSELNYNEENVKVINTINEKLENSFYNCTNGNQQSDIYKTLLTCSIVNGNSLIENAFRRRVVHKFVENEIALVVKNKISKQSLSNFYKNLLDFIPRHMKDLLFLTIYNKNVEGTNFLINSFWIEIEEKMVNNLPLMFSSGDPELFLSRLESTDMFLAKFEKIFGSKKHVKIFRNNQNTIKFLQCWNLTVYFQIRFQEILYDLEIASQDIPKKGNEVSSLNDKFGINFIDQADKALIKCWSNKIYNSKLFAKFLKLSMQIISRVNIWICGVLNNLTNNFKIDLIVMIYANMDLFVNKISFYTKLSQSKLPKQMQNDLSIITHSYKDSISSFTNLKTRIEEKLIWFLTKQSYEHLKFVADLSRMYRKTNREIPIERSIYVYNMAEIFELFTTTYKKVFDQAKLEEILKACFTKITEDYFTCINDVLLSIKRTEESLKRLKSVRAKTLSYTTSPTESAFVGDDDKIRMQLRIDIFYWIDKITKHTSKSNVPNLSKLEMLVELTSTKKN